MDNSNDIILVGLGALLFLVGLSKIINKVFIIKKSKIIVGEIYDRRAGYKDHYYPVIKYEKDNEVKEYQSSHHSILQKIGSKIRLVYNKKEKRILGTLGEMFFIPVNITLIGLFILVVMFLYKTL